jgi:general secretion pathway protein K
MMTTPKKTGEKGIALIVVLCITAVMVGAAVQMISQTRREVSETINLGDGLQALYLARSGIAFSKALLNAEISDYNGLSQSWANAETWSARFNASFEEGKSSIAIEDETGKIPINYMIKKDGVVNSAIRDLLVRLLNQPQWKLTEEQTEQIVNKLQDWMVKNSQQPLGSSESKTNIKGPFRFPEEILKTEAITKDLLFGTANRPGLNSYITIYGNGKININTTPKPVLKALFPGINEATLERLDQFRRTEKDKLKDPNWFRQVIGTSGTNPPSDLIGVKSEAFRVTSTGLLKGCRRTAMGILERDGNPEKFKLRFLLMNS